MKRRAPKSRTETIEVELDGEIHRGERIVTGVHELHQVVQFEALRKRDVNDYEPGDEAFMRAIAKVILRDLVEQWKAQGCGGRRRWSRAGDHTGGGARSDGRSGPGGRSGRRARSPALPLGVARPGRLNGPSLAGLTY